MKRSPLKRQSAKGALRASAWQKRKQAWLRLHPHCEGLNVLPRGCWGPQDVHHKQARGSGGGEDDSPLVTLCRLHHQYVEEHREEARSLGFLLRSKAYTE